MTRRFVLTALAAFVGLPASARAQGLAIDHKPIGCIVAGRFPKLNACFTPTADVARGRVYFQRAGGAHWHWVEFKPDAPCFTAILPKPQKTITEMNYYVEVADKQFHESRIDDRVVKVVPDAGGCDSDKPVAGWVQNASVTVGGPAGAPVVPAGFANAGIVGAGGASTGLIVGGVVLGGGAAAGGVALASGGDDGTSPTPTPPPLGSVPTPTPAPTIAPAATPTPVVLPTSTPTPAPFSVSCRVFPTSGNDPLLVTFDCCASTGTNLRFEYDFDGNGTEDARGVCRAQRIYKLSGVFTSLITTATVQRDYTALVTVREALADGARDTTGYRITVEGTVGLKIDPAKETVASRRVSWQADLDAADSAQVVVNGSAAVYTRRGRSNGAAAGRRGVNQIEVQVVQGRGAGRVSFDLRSMPSLVPGSLRVVAGEVLAVSDTAITFRLRGKSGERVVFTLEAAD